MPILELLHENRSGIKTEAVVCVYNEEKRIIPFINFFSKWCDIVLLDDGSQDKTIAIAIANGATVFHRKNKEIIGEAYFAQYCNELTKSGKCLWIFADEYIYPKDMELLISSINNGLGVFGKRIDWFFGYKLNRIGDKSPRGFIKGHAYHNTTQLHSSLHFKNGLLENKTVYIEIHHLSLESTSLLLGKLNHYVHTEVAMIASSAKPIRKFIRRFILIEPIYLSLVSLWKEKNKKPSLVIYIILRYILTSTIALMIFIEKRCLINLEKQRERYAKFFE